MEYQTKIQSIISLCTKKDIVAWQIVARSLLEHVEAIRYIVIVPEKYLDDFRMVTPKPYEVISETSILKIDLEYCRQRLGSEGQKSRAGWYYQQILKLKALEVFSCAGDAKSVIWDADTVMLKPMPLLGKDRLVLGLEYPHAPYFDLVSDLGLKPESGYSLISQFIQASYSDIKGFLGLLSSRNKQCWIDYLLTFPSGDDLYFSEYETLGRYLVQYRGYVLSEVNWSREIPFSRVSLSHLEVNLKKTEYYYIGLEYPDLLNKLHAFDRIYFYYKTYGFFNFIVKVIDKAFINIINKIR